MKVCSNANCPFLNLSPPGPLDPDKTVQFPAPFPSPRPGTRPQRKLLFQWRPDGSAARSAVRPHQLHGNFLGDLHPFPALTWPPTSPPPSITQFLLHTPLVGCPIRTRVANHLSSPPSPCHSPQPSFMSGTRGYEFHLRLIQCAIDVRQYVERPIRST